MKKTIANIEDFCQTYGRLPYLYVTGGDPHHALLAWQDLLNSYHISPGA